MATWLLVGGALAINLRGLTDKFARRVAFYPGNSHDPRYWRALGGAFAIAAVIVSAIRYLG